jgi:hypothetical protein
VGFGLLQHIAQGVEHLLKTGTEAAYREMVMAVSCDGWVERAAIIALDARTACLLFFRIRLGPSTA